MFVTIADRYIGVFGAGATLEGDYDNTSAGFPLITLKNPIDITIENLTFANHFGNESRGILVWGAGDNINILIIHLLILDGIQIQGLKLESQKDPMRLSFWAM